MSIKLDLGSFWPWGKSEPTPVVGETQHILATSLVADDLVDDVEPFFLDLTGDGLEDILYSRKAIGDAKGELAILVQKQGEEGEVTWEKKTFEDDYRTNLSGDCLETPVIPTELANPHFNSYQDLNGDCIPDLFLTTFYPETQQTFAEAFIQVED